MIQKFAKTNIGYEKKNIQDQKNVFVNFFFLVSIFAKHWYNEEKKTENYYQQRLKKTEKTKLERILKFRLRNENKKKIVVLEVGRWKKKIDKMAVTFVNLTKVTELTDKLKQLKKQWAWNRHS